MTRVAIPVWGGPIGRTKGKDGEPGEDILPTVEYFRFLDQLAAATGNSTTGFPDADLVGIPSYDIIAQLAEMQERLLSLEGRIVERDTDPRQELLDLAALAGAPHTGLQGPSSSTDNAAARWDGSSGQKLQNSLFLISDAGNVTSFGGQIAFPAVEVVSGDPNTMTDYEKGTFIPTLGDGTNNYTLSTATGDYTKIGNRVFGNIDCIWSSIGAAGAGTLVLGTLPFAVGGNAGFAFGRIVGLDTTATLNQIVGLLTQTLSTIVFERVNDNAAQTALPANGSSATGRIIGSFQYRV